MHGQVFDFFNGLFFSSIDDSLQKSPSGNHPSDNVVNDSSSGAFGEKTLMHGPTLHTKPIREIPTPRIDLETSCGEHRDSTQELISPSCPGNDDKQGDGIEQDRQEEPRVSARFIDKRGLPYEACQDDLLDQHVAYYLKHHPDIVAQHSIYRLGPGEYAFDRREIQVEWEHADDPHQGTLMIVDGPLRQPFSDYMEMTENNAEYDVKTCNRSSLYSIPKEQRMSFHDNHKVYTRLEAMKVAKEQAAFREKHADYIKDGVEVPDDLMMKYKKTVQQKLGQESLKSSHHSSQPLRRNTAPSTYVTTRPPASTEQTGRRASADYKPQSVFASEPVDYFDGPGSGSSMWNAVWSPPGLSQEKMTSTQNRRG